MCLCEHAALRAYRPRYVTRAPHSHTAPRRRTQYYSRARTHTHTNTTRESFPILFVFHADATTRTQTSNAIPRSLSRSHTTWTEMSEQACDATHGSRFRIWVTRPPRERAAQFAHEHALALVPKHRTSNNTTHIEPYVAHIYIYII